ncbi:unnamed protein product, partial [Amoebophrya sp. A120]
EKGKSSEIKAKVVSVKDEQEVAGAANIKRKQHELSTAAGTRTSFKNPSQQQLKKAVDQ